MEKKAGGSSNSSAVFKIGTVSLVFLIIAYQVALFVHRAATLRLEAHTDRPDTVYIVQYLHEDSLESGGGGVLWAEVAANESGRAGGGKRRSGGSSQAEMKSTQRRGLKENNAPSQSRSDLQESSDLSRVGSAGPSQGRMSAEPARSETLRVASAHSPLAAKVQKAHRKAESFRFNPNTATIEELERLGFSEKQAAAIDNYRAKGGKFRRKSDFARSFVVSDSIYKRLERYIDIPLTDINSADSADFDALPGIGPYYAAQMVKMRERLRGYSHKEQLLDIWKFDSSKFVALSDLISCSKPEPYPLWQLSADSLRLHPYIGSWQAAKEIVMFREHTPSSDWSVEALRKAGILSEDSASKLARCVISPAK